MKLKNCRNNFYFLYKLDATQLLPQQVKQQVDTFLTKIEKTFPDTRPYVDLLAIHSPNHEVPIEQTWAYMQRLVTAHKVPGRVAAHGHGLISMVLNGLSKTHAFWPCKLIKYTVN
jgi:aryl-alcohol dehydrogenase-like predicted oxidoreductase